MAVQPIYRQIAEDLREQIESGVLEPGSQLPTELELREKYQASRNTIRDAIKQLICWGAVETRPGQGIFVTKKIEPFVTVLTAGPETESGGEDATYLSQPASQRSTLSATTAQAEIQTPPEAIAERLRLRPGSQVITRHQRRYIDDIPWSLQTSFYPMEFITRGATRLLMAEDIPEGTVRYLADTLGLRQAGFQDWITARSPDDNEQKIFGISPDSTVFEIFRTAFDQNKNPMRVTVTVFPTDRNQFIVNVGGIPPAPGDKDPSESA